MTFYKTVESASALHLSKEAYFISLLMLKHILNLYFYLEVLLPNSIYSLWYVSAPRYISRYAMDMEEVYQEVSTIKEIYCKTNDMFEECLTRVSISKTCRCSQTPLHDGSVYATLSDGCLLA